jgi:predicted TIM-barrel fold metal-dependent hydrolase
MEDKMRVCMPPDPNPQKPKFKPPPGTCDTHCHLFGPPQVFPYSERRRYTPPAAPFEHYMMMLDVIGVDRGIVVQPNVHDTDNRVSIDAIARSNGRLRGVGRIDDDTSDQELEAMHAGGIRGIRFEFVEGRRGSTNIPLFERMIERIRPLGWHIELHVDPNVLVQHADWFRGLDLISVVDHLARIQTSDGIDQPGFKLLLELMERPNYWVKISGADQRTNAPYPYADVVPFAHALIAKAPDRVIWGTNWPHSNMFVYGRTPNDGLLLNLMLDFAPDESIRNRILVDNPARLFGFDD